MLCKTTFYLPSHLVMDLGYLPWLDTTNNDAINILVHVSVGPLESFYGVIIDESVASLLDFLIWTNSYISRVNPTWSSGCFHL